MIYLKLPKLKMDGILYQLENHRSKGHGRLLAVPGKVLQHAGRFRIRRIL